MSHHSENVTVTPLAYFRRSVYFLCSLITALTLSAVAEPVHVRHLEGVTRGFLRIRDLDGKTIAYGELNQVVSGKDDLVTSDLQFQFVDGSSYKEVTKFTQRNEFRLV